MWRDEASEPIKFRLDGGGLCYLQHILCSNPHPNFADMPQMQLKMSLQFGRELISYPLGFAFSFAGATQDILYAIR